MVSGPVQKRGRSPARQNERPSWGGSTREEMGERQRQPLPLRFGESRSATPGHIGGRWAGRVLVRGDQPSRVGCIDLPGVRQSWNPSEDATWRGPRRAQRDGMCERPPAWLHRRRFDAFGLDQPVHSQIGKRLDQFRPTSAGYLIANLPDAHGPNRNPGGCGNRRRALFVDDFGG